MSKDGSINPVEGGRAEKTKTIDLQTADATMC